MSILERAIGGVLRVGGAILGAIGNNQQGRQDEADMRLEASHQRRILGMQTALATDQAQAAHTNTVTDINRYQRFAGGQITAGAAASGVRSSSGSVQAVMNDMTGQAQQARDRAQESLQFALRGIDINQQQGEYDVSKLVRGADREAAARPLRTWGDMLGIGATAIDAYAQFEGARG